MTEEYVKPQFPARLYNYGVTSGGVGLIIDNLDKEDIIQITNKTVIDLCQLPGAYSDDKENPTWMLFTGLNVEDGETPILLEKHVLDRVSEILCKFVQMLPEDSASGSWRPLKIEGMRDGKYIYKNLRRYDTCFVHKGFIVRVVRTGGSVFLYVVGRIGKQDSISYWKLQKSINLEMPLNFASLFYRLATVMDKNILVELQRKLKNIELGFNELALLSWPESLK